MKLARRQFLSLALGAAAPLAVSRIAGAQAYPTRPVHIISGFAAGGGTDVAARIMGQWLSERLGQPFVIENRPGAGSNVAAEAVVRSAPDGYTLFLANSVNAINATLYEKLNFNFIRDTAPVAGIIATPSLMIAHPSVPAATVAEFIAHAKSNLGKVNMASAGNGSVSHMAGELFKMMASVDLLHVPYRGASPALTDLLGGQVQIMFASAPSSIEYVRTGKVCGLAVTTAKRSSTLPDLPTVGESVPGYEVSAWYGLVAPKETPSWIIEKLNKEINAGLADSKMRARLADVGGTVLQVSPTEFGKLIADDTEKWGKVVQFVGVKLG
jgi:tripartite-type tricarboxylate transporter receptor subunit TctC